MTRIDRNSVAARETVAGGFRVRQGFTDAERERVAELYAGAFGHKLGRILGRGRRAAAFLADSLDPDFALVGEDAADGRPIAVAGFRSEEGGLTNGFSDMLTRHYGTLGGLWRRRALELLETPERADKLLVDGIAVDPAWRGRGIGSAMMAALEDIARDRGKRALRLDVIDRNMRARALYARLGFIETASHDLGALRHLYGFARATQMTKML